MISGDSMRVRDANVRDLRDVLAIERLAFGDAWTRGMFMSHLRGVVSDSFIIACDSSDRVAGYAITRVVEAECELFNLAVHPELRRGGLGAMLLDACMDHCASAGAREMWLEVRASNQSALRLYLRHGFTVLGRRKGYYDSPREDALLLQAALWPSVAGSKSVQRAGAGLPGESCDLIISSASQPSRQETI